MANLSNINNKFIVESDGDVGIGVTTALDKLNVGEGNIRISQAGNVASQLILNTYQSALGNSLYNWFLQQTTSANSYSFQIGMGSTPYLHINSVLFGATAGNIGIGTTSPLNRTHIVGPTLTTGTETTYGLAVSDVGDETKTLILGYDLVNDVGIIQAIDQQTAWKNLAFAISGNTKVGIGTTSPGTKLEIYGDTSSGGFGAYPALTIKNDNTSGFSAVHFNQSTNQKARIEVSNSAGSMGLYTTSGYNGILINSSGNVGIGHTTPQFGLTMAQGSGDANRIGWEDGSNSKRASILCSSSTDALQFHTGTSDTERMRIDSSGVISIGPSTTSSEIYFNYNNTNNKGGLKIDYSTAELRLSAGESGNTYHQAFYTNGAERMRITSVGQLGVNTTTFAPTISNQIKLGNMGSGVVGEVFDANVVDGAGRMIICSGGNTGQVPILSLRHYSAAYGIDLWMGYTNPWNTYIDNRHASSGFIFRNNCNANGGEDELMRITGGGFTKAKTGGNYFGGNYHEFLNNNNVSGDRVMVIGNTAGNATNNTSSIAFTVADSANDRLFIYGNGNVVNFNNSYGAMSDVKLKENIIDATSKLDDLMKVKIRNYNFIGDDKKQIGVVAQELEDIFPNMIDESIDYEYKQVTDEEGNTTEQNIDLGTTTKSVKYSVFVPMLIKAIQELKAEIDELKK